ncbi:hypothetical protein DPEC_G00259430 [Dallia pectoralis]|uniref:Uncharacterized protein n=1 Tax=Dallia pectoralis TaxID=75939 RepID=A0ACC2FR27_DALPE|nr:hypothetical protein DPEC_G00259430 [Dallia pectoralis]
MFPNACLEAQQLDTVTKTAHLTKLQDRYEVYFPERHSDTANAWIRDPFNINMESVMLPSNEEHQLVELSCDQTVKKRFGESKQRNRLNIEHDLRVALTTVTPDFAALIKMAPVQRDIMETIQQTLTIDRTLADTPAGKR